MRENEYLRKQHISTINFLIIFAFVLFFIGLWAGKESCQQHPERQEYSSFDDFQ